MSEAESLYRITVNPAVLMVKPVIRAVRISVDHIIRSLAGDISTSSEKISKRT